MEQRGSVFYYRRRVPKDLTAVIGREVIKETLRERDPVRARHAQRALAWEDRFARLRRKLRFETGPLRAELTDTEIAALGDHHRRTLLSEDDQIRLYGLGGNEEGLPDDQFERHGVMLDYVEQFARDDLAKGRVTDPGRGKTLDDALAALDIRLDPKSDSYRRAGREILVATIEAMQAARRRQGGEPVRTPEPATVSPVAKTTAPVTVDDLIDGWSREAQPVEKTIYTFRNHITEFADFAGKDLSQADTDRAAEWKLEILKSFSAKTVSNKIASCKAIFAWAKANRVLRTDPQ